MAATELAVCLPIIVLLVVATVEACSMVFLKQSLSVAAYEGVRTAISNRATTAEVQGACQQILADRQCAGGDRDRQAESTSRAVNPGDLCRRDGHGPVCGQIPSCRSVLSRPTLSATASMMIEF